MENGADADKPRVGGEAHLALKVFQERHGDNFDARLFQVASGDTGKDGSHTPLGDRTGGEWERRTFDLNVYPFLVGPQYPFLVGPQEVVES